MSKVCSKCKENKEHVEFAKKRNSLCSMCKSCQNLYSRTHYQQNKDKYILKSKKFNDKIKRMMIEYKKVSGGCSRCNEKDYICLDFHHTTDDKENHVATLVANSCSWAKIQKEIDKCIILCSNCHRKLHRDERLAS